MLGKRLLSVRAAAGSCAGALLWMMSAASVQAWGPHATITEAALDALGTNDTVVACLGPSARQLTNYCLLADFHRLLFEDGGSVFYADDYLLFPGAMPQWDHTGSWLKGTFRPGFERALQALRTEDRVNAARWIGALLHYAQDAGAPPHALALKGALHWKMECWVNTNAIQIRGYCPQLFGTNDSQALEGFLRRMGEVDAFARTRGKRLRLQIDIGNRRGVMPVVLECALESSRLSADLLHTLGTLAGPRPGLRGATLAGTISGGVAPGLEKFPAKVLVVGTNLSTLADLQGRFEFHNLPPGTYQLVALRPGGGTVSHSVTALAGRTNLCHLAFSKRPGNWLRNGDFRLRWVNPGAPDCWYKTGADWEGEFVPLVAGKQYRVSARFQPEATGKVLLKWTARPERPLPFYALRPKFVDETLEPAKPALLFTASSERGVFQVVLPQTTAPGKLVDRVTLEMVEPADGP